MHELDQALADREAEPVSFVFAGMTGRLLPEFLEDVGQKGFADAGAGILHLQRNMLFAGPDPNGHPTVGSEFDGVRQNVG